MPADRRLAALFGSEARLRTLGVLANAFRPLTGYRVGRTADVALPKVYRELRRLQRVGLVAHAADGWTLTDPDVESFLRKRYRVSWSVDWFQEVARRASDDKALLARLRRLPPPKFPRGWKPRARGGDRRRRDKDALLADLGQGPSLHD